MFGDLRPVHRTAEFWPIASDWHEAMPTSAHSCINGTYAMSPQLIHAESLSETVDAVNEAFADGVKLAASARREVALWIASRQGLPGAYAHTFAAFDAERKRGIQLFTGERATSASARHILGEESCRVLHLLGVRDRVVQRALDAATAGLMQALERAACDPRHTNPGVFCCGKCTVGLWRHLIAGGLDRQEERLVKGVRALGSKRDGRGGWRTFPFWYTVLALSEIDVPAAATELRHVSDKLERAAARSAGTRTGMRRKTLAQRALGRV